jgi:hypothetical protein
LDAVQRYIFNDVMWRVRRFWSQWKEALFLVQPETVVRWHRAGFELYWAMLCKVRKRIQRRLAGKHDLAMTLN